MAELIKPIILDETGQAIVAALDKLKPSSVGYSFVSGVDGSFKVINNATGEEVDISTLPIKTSSDAGKAIIVNSNGTGFTYGEAGKVDNVLVNNVSVVSDKVANITVPTKTSELSNDSNFVDSSYHDATKQDVISDLATIRAGAAKGATALQSFTESDPIFSASAAANIKSSDITSWNDKQDKITNSNKLAYSLISGTPTIPTDTNQLTNGAGFITNSALGTQVTYSVDATTKTLTITTK